MRRLYLVLLMLVLALMGGCAGTVKHMQPAALDKTAVVKPDPGKALLVFMRPSGLGYAVQSSVFKINSGGTLTSKATLSNLPTHAQGLVAW